MSDFKHIENNPKLKQNTFKVPDNYFENLEERLQKITQEDKKIIPISRPKSFARTWSIAASFALLFAASWYFWPNQATLVETELSTEDVATLSANGFLYNAETYFLENLSLEELDEIVLTENDYSDYLEITQPSAIEDYYLDSDINF